VSRGRPTTQITNCCCEEKVMVGCGRSAGSQPLAKPSACCDSYKGKREGGV
jgi:hypothetical protein